jgi:type I restriction enzyme S subunit
MEVRPGFKQTEIGVIPEDWEAAELGAHATFKTGPFGSALHRSDYVEGGIPVVNPMQIVDGRIRATPSMAITEAAARKLSEFRLSTGNVVIGRRGDMGRCAVVGSEEEGWLCGTGSMIIRARPSLDSEFLQRILSSPPIIAEIENASVGTTMINMNQGTLGRLLIPFPPVKSEQEAVAKALRDADMLIESVERLLVKKRDLKRGAMQELLTGERRLPGFSGEWGVRSLRSCLLASPDYGINAPGVPVSGDLPTYLRITDIDDDGRYISVNRVAVNHSLAMNYLLGKNEIVFARTGASVGKTYLYDAKDGELVFAGFLIRARIDCQKLNPDFFAAYTRTSSYWGWVRVMSMRSGQPGINGNEFASLELCLPPTVEEQHAVAGILSDMDADILALERKLAKAKLLKQGMMQELLTGRIRLV